ncbi:MAG: Ku protein [Pirellulales bacterium]
MPAKQKKRQEKDGRHHHPRGVRPFWSGTISFGLVSVPVHLFPGRRSGGVAMRMLDEDGTPLARRYHCPEHEVDVHPEHIVRGYELEDGSYVVIRDEELEAISPKKSREIDLRRFVDIAQVSPTLFDRPYFLTPAGDSTKAYRLLADVMHQTQKAGIATFVMRGKEYLVAILSHGGVLSAQTLRFPDEIRDADDVGLPEAPQIDREQVSRFEKAIRKHSVNELPRDELKDASTEQLTALVEKKRKKGQDIVETEDYEPDASEPSSDVDLMEAIRRDLQGGNGAPQRSDADGSDLEDRSKEELYALAKQRNVPGRSKMNRDDLITALRKG